MVKTKVKEIYLQNQKNMLLGIHIQRLKLVPLFINKILQKPHKTSKYNKYSGFQDDNAMYIYVTIVHSPVNKHFFFFKLEINQLHCTNITGDFTEVCNDFNICYTCHDQPLHAFNNNRNTCSAPKSFSTFQ